ncbi:MAG: ATP-binding protein [bacterium]|nr:ATP-binding protein [bacterium]
MKFYDRKDELEKLAKFETLAERELFFIRVTGRRRIGKTLLIREYLNRSASGALYFFVTKKKEKLLLEEYSTIISEQFTRYPGIGFKDFDDFFKFLFSLMKEEKRIVVFDEFQNFKYVNEAVFSILQKHIDLNKQQSNGLMLIVGSINSMMRRIFESRDQPLYGRLNGSFLLKHFNIATIKEILGDHGLTSNDDLLFFYSIFEGIPFYYNYISERKGYSKSRKDLLKEDLLDENSILLDEGKEILVEEFGKDYSTYFSILEAISRGATTISRISDVSGINIGSLSRYLSQLIEDHELVERRVPFDAKTNNKMGRYFINDNFMDFWFRYIFKNKSRIEIMNQDRIAAEILEDMPTFTGKKFEKLMITHLMEMNREGSTTFDRIGQYWDRGETEIDIIFTNDRDKEIVFGECKRSANRFRVNLLESKIKKFLSVNRKYAGGNWKKTLNLYTPGEADFLYKSIPLE